MGRFLRRAAPQSRAPQCHQTSQRRKARALNFSATCGAGTDCSSFRKDLALMRRPLGATRTSAEQFRAVCREAERVLQQTAPIQRFSGYSRRTQRYFFAGRCSAPLGPIFGAKRRELPTMPAARARAPAMSPSACRLPSGTGTNGLPALHMLSSRVTILVCPRRRQ